MKTQRTHRFRAVRRLSTVLMFGAMLTFTMTVSLFDQHAWAAPTDTGAGTPISNTAQIDFTVSGVVQPQVNSTAATFVVDHKVRPVVTWQDGANVPVVAGSANQALTFQVLNDGNTAGTATFNLSSLGAGPLNMVGITFYAEEGTTPGFQAAEDGAQPSITSVDLARDTSAIVYLVASTPGGAAVGQTGTYDLIADSPLTEPAADDTNAADTVFADDAGTAAGDVAFDSQHSDAGVFEALVVNLSATKTSAVVDDLVNAAPPYFAIPGAIVEYTITVTNTSALLPATGVTVGDAIPANTDFVNNSTYIGATNYLDSDPEVTYVAGPPETLSVDVGPLAPGCIGNGRLSRYHQLGGPQQDRKEKMRSSAHTPLLKIGARHALALPRRRDRYACGRTIAATFNPCFSSLEKGACRTWGLVCVLFLILLCMPIAAGAVPPNTPISNTAGATFSVWGTPDIETSNTVTIFTVPERTPSQIEFMQYAPLLGSAQPMNVAATAYDPDGAPGGSTQQIAAIYPAGSTTAIDLSQPVELTPATVYHQGEPLFILVTDLDQNTDAATRQSIWILVAALSQGDSELLLLTESGPDSGAFIGYIQSSGLGPMQNNNGVLDVTDGEQISVHYTDPLDAADTAFAAAMVDPYGLVFDSSTGQPVDNVQVTLVEDATGLPAQVYGDDGVSSFPSTIASGGTFVDGGGKVYAFATGRYRFPFVIPGTYRLAIVPPNGYAAPSSVATAALQTLPGGPFILAPGSREEAFILNPGPAVRIDIPVDPSTTGLWLRKSANQKFAAIGDVVQYTVTVENTSGDTAVNTTISDQLPRGVRYRSGSLVVDGQPATDPLVAGNGRTLTLSIGDLADGRSLQLRYVVEITAGAKPGKAENRVWATAADGLTSNIARASVTVKEDLFRSDNFLAGRVIADNCSDSPTETNDGVAGVRIYLEDGTYAVTDEHGMYHFEGIASGTHVVQMDLESIPPNYAISLCSEDTRQASTPFSRFVELHGGTLWREDFHLQTKAPPSGQAVLKMTCQLDGETVHYDADIAVQSIDVQETRLAVVLPQGGTYLPGSTRLNGQSSEDPQTAGLALTYTLGAISAGQTRRLRFSAKLGETAQPGQLHTRALLFFDTPANRRQRTEMIDTVLALNHREERSIQPPVIVRPQFDTLSAQLTPTDRQLLDRLAAGLTGMEIEHALFIGHTDNRLVRPGNTHLFADNQALSLGSGSHCGNFSG
jgi:uncharacterized repeat protein (TIGR01451 family)